MNRLRILEGPRAGELIPLREGDQIAGRVPEVEIHLPSRRVSRKHASFSVEPDGRCILRDLGSANGVLVNGHPMEACELVHGTHIQIGDALMVYEDQEEEQTQAPADDFGPPPDPFGGPPPSAFGGPSEDTGAHLGEPIGEPTRLPGDMQPPPGPAPELEPAMGPPPGLGAPTGGGFGAPGGGFGAPSGAPPQGGFGGPVAAGPIASGPQADAEPGSSTSPAGGSAGGLSSKIPFMGRVVGLFMLLGLILLCGPIGGFISLAKGGADALEQMSVERGVAIAQGVGHSNAASLAARGLDYELASFERLDEVGKVLLLGSDGSVVAPINQASKSLADDELFKTAKKERREATQPGEGGLTRIIVPVRGAPNAEGSTADAPKVVVGYAYIEYDAATAAAAVASPMTRLAASLLFLALVLGGAVGGVFVFAERPLRQLRDEAELAISGHNEQLQAPVKWGALEDLTHTLNRALARAAGRPDPSPAPAAEPVVQTVVEKVVEPDARVDTLLAACTFPVILLDAEGRVAQANDWGQHLLGRPLAELQGQALLDLVAGVPRDRLDAMWQGISQGQAPVLADDIDFGEGPRSATLAAGPGLSHAILVVL